MRLIQYSLSLIMQDYGLVSIITPTWACAGFIGETIRSVQAQTYQSWELLIQDDCSKDKTLEVVKPYMDNDTRIKYECNPQNSGAAITRNYYRAVKNILFNVSSMKYNRL